MLAPRLSTVLSSWSNGSCRTRTKLRIALSRIEWLREFSTSSENWNRIARVCSCDGFGNSCRMLAILRPALMQVSLLLLSWEMKSLSFSTMALNSLWKKWLTSFSPAQRRPRKKRRLGNMALGFLRHTCFLPKLIFPVNLTVDSLSNSG